MCVFYNAEMKDIDLKKKSDINKRMHKRKVVTRPFFRWTDVWADSVIDSISHLLLHG